MAGVPIEDALQIDGDNWEQEAGKWRDVAEKYKSEIEYLKHEVRRLKDQHASHIHHEGVFRVTFLVPDYTQGIDFFTKILGFRVAQDQDLGNGKRFVIVVGKNDIPEIMIAKAEDSVQVAAVGKQAGSGVAFFLETADFETDHARMKNLGIEFLENPRHEPYGIVAVFRDPFGNKWDLIQKPPQI